MGAVLRTNSDLTIYHRSITAGAEVWTRQAVSNAMWENRKAANVLRSGLLEADAVTVYVPFARGAIAVKVGDVLVKGAVTDTISGAFTMSDLKAKYADVVTVRSVDTMDYGSSALQHWEIGAS
jgi:hypothetical protein